MLASVDFFITRFPSYRILTLFRACHWKYVTNLPLTLTLNPCHYQVHTFLIFTNILDKDLICLITKIQESTSVWKILAIFLSFFFYGIGTLKKWYWQKYHASAVLNMILREITWCSNSLGAATKRHLSSCVHCWSCNK